MAKFRLDERIVPKVTVLGISSHVADYRLCWSLNRTLGLDMSRRREDITDGAGAGMQYFSVFFQRDEEGEVQWSLVSNNNGTKHLIPKEHQADYFLVVDRDTAKADPDLLDRVRSAEFVLTAYPVDFDRMKLGHKLLL